MILNEQLHEVPAAATEEWAQANVALKKGYEHFLEGFRLAANGVYPEWPKLKKAADRKQVFDRVQRAAEQICVVRGNMGEGTFARYCKIARYCLIYCVPWAIGSEANREQLRWCQDKADTYRGDESRMVKMVRAWEEMPTDLRKKKRTKEDEEEGDLRRFPNRSDYETNEAFWTDLTKLVLTEITNNQDSLQDETKLQNAIRRFVADVHLAMKAKKTKVA